MKKLISLIICIATLFTLCSCKEDYPPVESTEEEARVVFTFEIDNTEYEVRYELYRALFLASCSKYDNGDKSFWNTDEAADAKEEINDLIIDHAAEIYATLHHAKKIGFDPYSRDADKQVDEHIRAGIEGDLDAAIEGFGGDYEAYLAWLSSLGLNYSTQTLLLRYAIAYDNIINYYAGDMSDDEPSLNATAGALEYTESDVKSFYHSNDCVRVSIIEINSAYISYDTAKERRDKIASFSSSEDALNYAVSLTAGTPADILDGAVIGTLSLDASYYAAVTKAAFELDINETSELIEIFTDTTSEYWILYRQAKTDEYFNSYYSDIKNVYVAQKIGEILLGVKNELIDSCTATDVLDTINHAEVTLP